MPLISQQFLQSLDIAMDEQTYQAFAEHFETTLEDRVINAVIDELEEKQMSEITALKGQGDDAVQAWLQANVPNLDEIIRTEVDILLGDLAEHSESL